VSTLAYVPYEKRPVASGCLLIIPRRRVADWFQSSAADYEAILALADKTRALPARKFAPDGCNPGINLGDTADQAVFHVHLRLIARVRGDVSDLRGGVRRVIPAQRHD
jgi:diadenosine tetraphosphate (Ap4A) HIT family hydrolase